MSGTIAQNPNRQSGAIGAIASATKSASDPATNTNPSSGVGAEWINTTTGQIFICTNATTDENTVDRSNRYKYRKFWDYLVGGQSAGAGTQVNTIEYITIFYYLVKCYRFWRFDK